jgi:hypothetical protein
MSAAGAPRKLIWVLGEASGVPFSGEMVTHGNVPEAPAGTGEWAPSASARTSAATAAE